MLLLVTGVVYERKMNLEFGLSFFFSVDVNEIESIFFVFLGDTSNQNVKFFPSFLKCIELVIFIKL